jgi:hypothetical protein
VVYFLHVRLPWFSFHPSKRSYRRSPRRGNTLCARAWRTTDTQDRQSIVSGGYNDGRTFNDRLTFMFKRLSKPGNLPRLGRRRGRRARPVSPMSWSSYTGPTGDGSNTVPVSLPSSPSSGSTMGFPASVCERVSFVSSQSHSQNR